MLWYSVLLYHSIVFQSLFISCEHALITIHSLYLVIHALFQYENDFYDIMNMPRLTAKMGGVRI